MTRLFTVGLIPLKIMYRSSYLLPGCFARTYGVDDMPNSYERLKRDHHLVVLDIIADQHKELFGTHCSFLSARMPGTPESFPHSLKALLLLLEIASLVGEQREGLSDPPV